MNKDLWVHFPESVVFQRFDEKAILLNLKSEEIYELNESGTQVAELISQGVTLEDIIDTLKIKYSEDSHGIEGDVLDLLVELSKKQLVKLSSPNTQAESTNADD